MADVVRLKEFLERMPPKRVILASDTPAEILLFTGVRYERLTPAMTTARKQVATETARRP